jgi:hypothetical protein
MNMALQQREKSSNIQLSAQELEKNEFPLLL